MADPSPKFWASLRLRPVQFAILSGVTMRWSSVPVSASPCVAISAMPATDSVAAAALVPKLVQFTAELSMVPFTADCRKLAPALVPSSTVMMACSSSGLSTWAGADSLPARYSARVTLG